MKKLIKKIIRKMQPKTRIRLIYFFRTNKILKLNKPSLYNEKIQWLKLNWNDRRASICADKYEVREIVKEKIGERYLNKLIAVYHSVEEIDLSVLPKKFVLKGTHGSGFNIICTNKDHMNWDFEFNKMRTWLNVDYFALNDEWVYEDIKPRIVCEEYIASNTEGELQDYRIFCFDGVPKFVSVDFSITDKSKTRRNIYDLNWNLMEAEIHYPNEKSFELEKPKKLEEMLMLAKKLSEGFPHVRVDFFYYEDQIIFGELTFFHQSGMANIKPDSFNLEMGKWIHLPNEMENI